MMPKVRTCKHCQREATKGNLCDAHQVGESVKPRTDNLLWVSAQGKKLRASYLAMHPYCFDHMTMFGEPVPATEVHHLVEQIDRPDLVLEASNLVSLCHACHNARHGKRATKDAK